MGAVVEGLPIVVYEILSLAMNHVDILKEGSTYGPLALLFPVWMWSRGFQNKSNKNTMKNEKKKNSESYHKDADFAGWFDNIRLYSVVVITFGFDPNNPGSNPGTTYHFL